MEGDLSLGDRPPLELVIRKFRSAKITSFVAAFLFSGLFIGIWPASMLSVEILDEPGFSVWTTLSRGWAFLAAAFIILVPAYQEVRAVVKQFHRNKSQSEEKLLQARIDSHIAETREHCF